MSNTNKKKAEPVKEEETTESGVAARASSKVEHHATLLDQSLNTIESYWPEASDEAKAKARKALKAHAAALAKFIGE